MSHTRTACWKARPSRVVRTLYPDNRHGFFFCLWNASKTSTGTCNTTNYAYWEYSSIVTTLYYDTEALALWDGGPYCPGSRFTNMEDGIQWWGPTARAFLCCERTVDVFVVLEATTWENRSRRRGQVTEGRNPRSVEDNVPWVSCDVLTACSFTKFGIDVYLQNQNPAKW